MEKRRVTQRREEGRGMDRMEKRRVREEGHGVVDMEERRGRDEERAMVEIPKKRKGRDEGCGVGHTKRRRKLPRMDLLPVDVVGEILTWLPVRDFARCRCVCRSWCTLIDSVYFEDLHLVRANKHRFATSKIMFNELSELKMFMFRSLKRRRGVKKRGVRERKGCMMLQAVSYPFIGLHLLHTPCHGLNLAFDKAYTYVFNPCTRDMVMLPDFTTESIRAVDKRLPTDHRSVLGLGYHHDDATQMVGLGYDSCAQEHKVVRVFHVWLDGRAYKYSARCEVLTLGNSSISCIWRPAMDPPYPVRDCPPVYADGVVYWVIETYYCCQTRLPPCAILAFDVREERFREVPLPPLFKDVKDILDHISLLQSSDGSLCLAHHREKETVVLVDIWMLTDSCRGLWRKVCFILINQTRKNGRLKNAFPIAITKDKVYLYKSKTLVSTYHNSSIICDTLLNTFLGGFHVAFYEKSVVSPHGRRSCC